MVSGNNSLIDQDYQSSTGSLRLNLAAHTFAGDCLQAATDSTPSYAPDNRNAIVSPYIGSSTKRAFDLTLTLVILSFLVLFLILIALAIKFSSRGPILFKQSRNGLSKRPFMALKFRSMYVQCCSREFRQAEKNDKRITSLGRIMRKTSVDELPQLVNVLRGEMSLVGPRPHPLALDASFASLIPGYDRRHLALPGLTGLAQVEGARGETSTLQQMQKRIGYDLYYVQNASLWLDLKIVAKSIPEALFSKQAF